MTSIPLVVKNSNLPEWLPTPYAVIMKCRQHGPGPSGFMEYSLDHTESAWIKYGPLVAMGEPHTQVFIADIMNSDKGCIIWVPCVLYAFWYEGIEYILMQHICGQDCSQDDFDQIALTVKQLRSISSPTIWPGPVRGGPVTRHSTSFRSI